jgi:hypothetical protein
MTHSCNDLFPALGLTLLVRELHQDGARTKRSRPFDKGLVYRLLNNRVYVGDAVHKGASYPGEHEAIIDRETFDKVQAILATNGRARAMATRSATPPLLKGLIFTDAGRAMTPHHTKKGTRLYRYYVWTDAIRGRDIPAATAPLRLPADTAESAGMAEIRGLLRAPEIVVQALAAARQEIPAITERDVVAALDRFHEIWSALFPAEQPRIIRLLVERVTVMTEGLAVDLRGEGIATLVREMLTSTTKEAAE